MTSHFAWMDYSERERQKVMDVLDLLRHEEARDELGLGAIRDAFSDTLFPGTGTVQTRARYFLFVPWIYLDLERKDTPSSDIARKARIREVQLIEALAESEDPDGTIGIDARGSLKRLPSNIYWNGLGVLGIRHFAESQAKYHRSFGHFYRAEFSWLRSDEADGVWDSESANWHPGLPASPKGFPKSSTFRLTYDEASYMEERIQTRARDTLLAFLVRERLASQDIDLVWNHPHLDAFPASISNEVKHARNFSEIMHGAVLLYNLMMAEEAPGKDLTEEYRDMLKQWSALVRNRLRDLRDWDLGQFWSLVRLAKATVSAPTRSFVERWIQIVTAQGSPAGIPENAVGRKTVRDRERIVKKGKARLGNTRALECWSGASGIRQLDYRWKVAQTMVRDIVSGFGEE